MGDEINVALINAAAAIVASDRRWRGPVISAAESFLLRQFDPRPSTLIHANAVVSTGVTVAEFVAPLSTRIKRAILAEGFQMADDCIGILRFDDWSMVRDIGELAAEAIRTRCDEVRAIQLAGVQ